MSLIRQIKLKEFSAGEILLSDDEARIILTFFFPYDAGVLQSFNYTQNVKGFAQALLIEAIDASSAMGSVESLFRANATPSATAASVIKTFGRKSAQHLFDSANANDLQDVTIIECVRVTIARNFKTSLDLYLNGVAILPREFKNLVYQG